MRRGSAGAVSGEDAIPVLLYHAITDAPSAWIAPFTVSRTTFARHLDVIEASGRTAISVETLHAASAGDRALPPRPLVITFDDGFVDLVETVAPMLAQRRLPATMFLTTGFLDRRSPGGDPMLSWSAAAEVAEAGFEIGAHSVSHPQLDTVRTAVARYEVVASRRALQDRLGLPIRSFAYPHGYSDERVRRLVRTAGYSSAFGVKNALSHADDTHWSAARLMITSTTSDLALEEWLDGRGAPLASRRESWRTWGWRQYRRVRHVAQRRTVPVAAAEGHG